MENAVIRFRAKGQNLSLVSGYNRFAGNTIGYIRIEIEPDDEWLDFDSVDALFQNEQGRVSAVLFYDSGVYVCNAPVEMTAASSVVFLNLSGKNVVNNVLVERLTTYPVFAFAIDRSANVTSYRETEVSANMYEQYIAAVGDQVEKITDLTVSAHEADEPEVIKTAVPGLPINLDFGLVRGETGEQGIPGEPGVQGEPGVPGEKGDPFTYDDFTEEQLAALAGPQGPKGSTGDPAGFGNVTAEISNTSGTPTVEVTAAGPDTAKNIHFAFSNLKGDKGDTGDTGNGIASIDLTSTSGAVKTYTITFTDGTTTTFEVTDGEVTNASMKAYVDPQFADLKSELSDIAQIDNLVYYKTFDGEVDTDSDGYYSYSDGSYSKYASGATKTFICTKKFSVFPNSIITVLSNIPASDMMMLVWDANDNFIGTINTNYGVMGDSAYKMAINYKIAYEVSAVEYELDAPKKYTCAGDLCEALIPCIEPATFEDLEITFPITDYFLNANGSLSAMSGCNVSNLIKIPTNQYNRFLRITGYKFFDATICVFYDKYKQVIGHFPTTTDSTKVVQGEIVQIPFDAAYIRFGDCSSKTTAINATVAEEATTFKSASSGETPSKRLYGKKWLVIGDSWVSPYTLGQGVKIFADYVTDNLGCTLINKGVGGTGYWKDHSDNLAFYQRVPTFSETADIVTVFGSLNDLGVEDGVYGSQILGTYTDSTTNTVGGCINATFDAIEAKYPNAYITVLTPPPWDNSHGNNYPEQYVNLLKQICEYRSIPCLDLFHCSTLRPWDATFKATYYLNGGHANTLGHKRFSGLVQKFIEAVYYIEE